MFRTQLFPYTCSFCCCSSFIAKVPFCTGMPVSHKMLVTFSLLNIRRSVITTSTALHAFATACALRHTPPLSLSLSLSPSLSLSFRISVSAQSSPHNLHRVLDILLDSSQCLAQLTLARVGIARSVHVQLGASTRHKMRHSLSLPTVTCICMRALPHCYNGPTTSFLHSQPIQTPTSGPGLIGAAGQLFI